MQMNRRVTAGRAKQNRSPRGSPQFSACSWPPRTLDPLRQFGARRMVALIFRLQQKQSDGRWNSLAASRRQRQNILRMPGLSASRPEGACQLPRSRFAPPNTRIDTALERHWQEVPRGALDSICIDVWASWEEEGNAACAHVGGVLFMQPQCHHPLYIFSYSDHGSAGGICALQRRDC